MAGFVAVILIALSFALLLASRTLRRLRPAEYLTVWLALVLHHVISLYSVYVGTVFGARADAQRFYNNAAYAAENTQHISFGMGAQFYEWYLAWIFRLCLGPSLLLAQTLAVLAFLVALIYLLKLKDLLRIKHGGLIIIVLFSLEPAMLLWTSVNLREPYQLLFLILVLYFGIRGKITGRKGDLLKAGAALVPFGLLHNGLAAYAPLLFAALLWWDFSDQSTKTGSISSKKNKTTDASDCWCCVPGCCGAEFAEPRCAGSSAVG